MSTARHTAVEPDETIKSAPERYRAEIRHRRGWLWEVQLVTVHVIVLPAGPAPGAKPSTKPAEVAPKPLRSESRSDPVVVWGVRWARWKGRRLVAAAKRADVREGQPWAVVREGADHA